MQNKAEKICNSNATRTTELAAVAFGFFDGVHIGHQSLIKKLLEISKQNGYKSVVYTFSNHPMSVIGKSIPPMIYTAEERLKVLNGLGADQVCMVPFTEKLAQITYEDFMENLTKTIPIAQIVIGYNYRMGKNAMGNTERLIELGKRMGFGVSIVEPLLFEGKPVSSTRIRQCLQIGDLTHAEEMLGRKYSFTGKVVFGKQLGSKIGWPTVNIEYKEHKAMVPDGVYVTNVLVGGKKYNAITNIGVRPTVSLGEKRNIETHILDFHEKIYNQDIEIVILDKIREEKDFLSLDELCKQIKKDESTARKMFSTNGIDNR